MARQPTVIHGQAAGLDIGVMMLDNSLPRPLGDVGNARSFAFPISYDVIKGADTSRVIKESALGLVENAKESACRLLRMGARALTTCCGFLAIHQRELADEFAVPVASSSLMQIPLVLQTLRQDQRVAVLTVSSSTLTASHFRSAGITDEQLQRVTLVGLEESAHFYPMIMGEVTALDTDRARSEVVEVAKRAVVDEPSIGAFVFECTNLPPYADAVREETSRPVWDATALIKWLHSGVCVNEREHP